MNSTQTRSVEIASLSDLPTPSFVPIRYRPGDLGTWSGHLAFANDLIADVRPSLLVELGTHWGESYFTFCQSVFQNGLDCICYAVDHWLGEPHAGHYGEEVFQDVHQFNETHYRGFSYLLRTSFDDALQQFADGSIDLLHIDGLHTYEAVSHDLRTWLPKVKPGGIVLLHDIAVRHANFGVWRLWDELQEEFPRTFHFHHWWGLGVLQKPGGSVRSSFLDLLFNSSVAMAERVRRHYLMQTAHLENTRKPEPMAPLAVATGSGATESPRTEIRIYLFGASGYSEETSLAECLEFNQWKNLTFVLPAGTGDGPVRVDPCDCIAVTEIGRMALVNEATGEVLFSATEEKEFREVQFSSSALLFQGGAACCIVSSSKDPYFVLPASWKLDGPARLEISIRVQTVVSETVEQTTPSEATAETKLQLEPILSAIKARSDDEISRLQSALMEAEERGSKARAEAERLEGLLAESIVRIRQETQREIRILRELLGSAEDRLKEEAQHRQGLAELDKELQSMRSALEASRAQLENERVLRAKILNSKSWAVTKPLRSFMSMFKGGD